MAHNISGSHIQRNLILNLPRSEMISRQRSHASRWYPSGKKIIDAKAIDSAPKHTKTEFKQSGALFGRVVLVIGSVIAEGSDSPDPLALSISKTSVKVVLN